MLPFPGELPRLLPLEKVPWVAADGQEKGQTLLQHTQGDKNLPENIVYDKPFPALLCLS